MEISYHGIEGNVHVPSPWHRPRRYVRVLNASQFAAAAQNKPYCGSLLGKFVSPFIISMLLIWAGTQLLSQV